MSPKADGTRCYCLLGWCLVDDRPKHFTVLIDRRGEIKPIRMKVLDNTLFQGTLLDCELINLKSVPCIAVFDAIQSAETLFIL